MKSIRKNPEPKSLTEHKTKSHADFDNYAPQDPDELRRALFAEQGGICCYCMERIRVSADEMKIEHWQCQTGFPELQLAYSNLLGACRGNQIIYQEKDPRKFPKDQQTCDTRKADLTLSKNPSDPAYSIEGNIIYSSGGTISASDENLNGELSNVLNLNHIRLVNARMAILRSVKNSFPKRGTVSSSEISKIIDEWSGLHNGLYRPFCQVAVYWLNKRLRANLIPLPKRRRRE